MTGTPAVPARGYSWPPFEVGNEAAMTHGATSPRRVQPIADLFHAALIETAQWVAAPAFAGTVASWAWAEAQLVLLRAYIDEHGHFDAEGEERSAVRTMDRTEARLAKLRDQLGLNPTALSKLLATAAATATVTGDYASVAAIQAEGRRLLDARLPAQGSSDGPTPPGAGELEGEAPQS